MKAALFGISGLVGSATAPLLIGKVEKLIAPVRKSYGNSIANIETPIVDFNDLKTKHSQLLQGVDCVVYCLGSTLKKAGSVSAFRQIEWQLATNVASLAKASGVRRFVLLSASGTSPDSLIPYTKVKGEIERFVTELRFAELVIAKPSLLVGDRAESRIFEGVSIKLTRPLLKPLQRFVPKFAPIQDIQVARALALLTVMPLRKPVTIVSNQELIEMSGPPILSVISV